MSNQEEPRLGDEIKAAVQSAIDAKDFTRLNEVIGKTVNQALDSFEQALDGEKRSEKAGDSELPWYADRKRNTNESPQWYQQGGTFFPKKQAAASTRKKKQKQKNHQVTERILGNRKKQNANPFIRYRDRYDSPVAYRVFGILLSVVGWTLALGSGITEFILFLATFTLFGGEFISGMPLVMGLLLPFLVGGTGLACQGHKMQTRVKHYQKYVGFLGDDTHCELEALGYSIGLPVKKILKEIQKMIWKGWFKQGHLDAKNTSLIVTDEAYKQYLEAQKAYDRRQLEEQQKQQLWQKQAKAQEKAKAAQQQETSTESELPEDAKSVIQEGYEYLRQMKACNDAIPGEEISAKIFRLEHVIERIFQCVERHPELVEELRRFMKYYLPTTVKLLKAYEELDQQEVQGVTIQKSKQEIEQTLDTIGQAFENLLDSFFEDTAVDISSDISVMQTLMAQEGLLRNQKKVPVTERKQEAEVQTWQ